MFLLGADGGVVPSLAQVGAARDEASEGIQIGEGLGGVQLVVAFLAIQHNIGEGAGVAAGNGGHLLGRLSQTLRKTADQRLVRRDIDLNALAGHVDGEVGGIGG